MEDAKKPSKVIITVTDEEDGKVHISLEFDPPASNEASNNFASHHVACDFLEWLEKQAHVSDVEVEGE